MELTELQKEMMELLAAKKLEREEIFSVMLVLTKEEKIKKMITYLKEKPGALPDEIFESAGRIAFEEETLTS